MNGSSMAAPWAAAGFPPAVLFCTVRESLTHPNTPGSFAAPRVPGAASLQPRRPPMLDRIHAQWPNLLALAHTPTEEARAQLASSLVDLFFAEDINLNAREETLVNELLQSLLGASSHTARQELARQFAGCLRLPHTTALSLAREPLDVARPLLINSEVLTDEDLIHLASEQGRDHAEAIAQRAAISEAVADALVVTGDLGVMQMVVENLGAHLSERAIDILVEASRLTATLHRPLLTRPEMTASKASLLYWWVSQDLRRYTLQKFGLSSGQLDETLRQSIDDLLRDHAVERQDDTAMAAVANWLEERRAITPRLLPQLLRLGYFRLFLIVLSRLSHLPMPIIESVVEEPGGRMLAALCRSMNLDKANFISLFLLARGARPDDHIVHPRELSQALVAWDRLRPSEAYDMVASWHENLKTLRHTKREKNDEETETSPTPSTQH